MQDQDGQNNNSWTSLNTHTRTHTYTHTLNAVKAFDPTSDFLDFRSLTDFLNPNFHCILISHFLLYSTLMLFSKSIFIPSLKMSKTCCFLNIIDYWPIFSHFPWACRRECCWRVDFTCPLPSWCKISPAPKHFTSGKTIIQVISSGNVR